MLENRGVKKTMKKGEQRRWSEMDKKKTIAQYEAIRRLGQTNMLDKRMVQRTAFENKLYALVTAIEEDYVFILKHYSELMNLIEEKDVPKAYPIEATYNLVK